MFYGSVNPLGSCPALSVYLTIHFPAQTLSSKRLTSTCAYFLLPETDNCPSWISGRERMTVKNISWSSATKECCWTGGCQQGLNLGPPELQSDSHLTEPLRPEGFQVTEWTQVYDRNHFLHVQFLKGHNSKSRNTRAMIFVFCMSSYGVHHLLGRYLVLLFGTTEYERLEYCQFVGLKIF